MNIWKPPKIQPVPIISIGREIPSTQLQCFSGSTTVKHLFYNKEYRSEWFEANRVGLTASEVSSCCKTPPGPAQPPDRAGPRAAAPNLLLFCLCFQGSAAAPPPALLQAVAAAASCPSGAKIRRCFTLGPAKTQYCVVRPVKLICNGKSKMETSIYSISKEDFNFMSHYVLRIVKRLCA